MSNAHLFVAVREASAGTFDVLGELGAGPKGGVVYLAREIASQSLVVLKLEPDDDGAGGSEYFLDVTRELDASVPDVEMRCPRCRAKLRQWARFCTQCGLDVSGEAPASGEQASRMALREKVRAATEGQYEFLGDIPRSEGGGLVYFARDLTDGKIVALRLQKDMNKKFEVGVTRSLKAVGGDATPAAPAGQTARPAVTIVQRTPLTHVGPIPTPGPRVAAPPPPAARTEDRAQNPQHRAATPTPGTAAADAFPKRDSTPPAHRAPKLSRTQVAVAIVIGVIVILLLTQL